jgi:hypothetical protein
MVWFLAGARDSFLHDNHTVPVVSLTFCPVGTGCSFIGGGDLLRCKETLCLQVVPHTPSWQGVQLSTGTTLPYVSWFSSPGVIFFDFPNAAEMMEIMCRFTLLFLCSVCLPQHIPDSGLARNSSSFLHSSVSLVQESCCSHFAQRAGMFFGFM